MRLLITGAAGSLGSHLAERFLAEEHEVVGLDNLITGSADNISHLLEDDRALSEDAVGAERRDAAAERQGDGQVAVPTRKAVEFAHCSR